MSDVTRAGRLATLRQLLGEARYASQADLIEALSGEGITVSQPTLSKDLLTLGAVRQRATDGSLVYATGTDEAHGTTMDKLARLCAEMLQSLRSAGNQIVLKVPPGAAQYFAASLDAAALGGVMGTIAGDDTILVIAVDEAAADDVVLRISEMTKTGRPGTGVRDEH
ncbi:arginine repressor [Tessaracoccus sp. Z1128]